MKKNIALIPAYKPDKRLIVLSKELNNLGFYVLVIDDGSGISYSAVFDEVKSLAHVITYPDNMGKGYALKTGFQFLLDNALDYNTIVTLDADGQHLISDILKVSEMSNNNPGCLILGERSFPSNTPKKNKIGNKITSGIFHLISGTKVKDTQTGLRAFDRSLLYYMCNVEGSRYEYEMNVLLSCSKDKIRILGVDIETVYIDGNSSSHFKILTDSFKIYGEIFKFAASSFTGFVVDYVTFGIMTVLTGGLSSSISVPLSNITARIISASVNFTINKKYVFKDKGNTFLAAAKYFLLAACILCFNTVLISLLVNVLHINRYLSKLVTEIIFFTLSLIVQKFIIFKERVTTDDN